MIASTTEPYTGYYYQTSTGKAYTGKTPNARSSVLLVAIEENNKVLAPLEALQFIEFKPNHDSLDPTLSPNGMMNNDFYTSLTYNKNLIQTRALPSYHYSFPTEEDEKIGSYTRYFSKRTNNLEYLEISKEDYEKFTSKDSKVAFELYECISTPWYVGRQEYRNGEIVKNIEKKFNWENFRFLFGTYPQQSFNNLPPVKINNNLSNNSLISSPSTPTSTQSSTSSPSSGGGGGY